jgi:signal transduction histidine kinase
MHIQSSRSITILDSVSLALDLKSFMSRALHYGIESLGCNRGSVFLFDGSNETLQLFAQTHKEGGNIYFEKEEGIAGKGLLTGDTHIFLGEELKKLFVPWGSGHRSNDLRAIVTMPVFFQNTPQAVFCFDFNKYTNEPNINFLSPSEKEDIIKLSKEILDPRFANALNRMRIHQAFFDINVASFGPSRLRQVVSDYLTKVIDEFTTAGKRSPDFIYLQLVDRRRGVVRTIQGLGMPLIFQTSLSHSLESNDVQAFVIRNCQPVLILGKDPLLDSKIYHRFKHYRYVRLWVPLFPFPLARFVYRPGKNIVDVMKKLLLWRSPECYANNSSRITASWQNLFSQNLPGPIVYGTLEIAYVRNSINNLNFNPLTTDFASWCIAKSYELAESLFKATLPGSLNTIAKTVAELTWPEKSKLTVAMPSWKTPEIRKYPASSLWPVALPKKTTEFSPPSESPGKVEVPIKGYNTKQSVDNNLRELHTRLISTAENAVRVALRLDDHVADLYTLSEYDDIEENLGTEYPDSGSSEILQEICREAAAEYCVLFLFEKNDISQVGSNDLANKNLSLRLLGIPHHWPSDKIVLNYENYVLKLAKQVSRERTPSYDILKINEKLWRFAAIPLELAEKTQSVIILHYPTTEDISDSRKRELEGHVARWVHRVSLRNLILSTRFSRLMRSLRADVSISRLNAIKQEPGTHLQSFAKELITKFSYIWNALASVLTLYSKPATGPLTVERFWCCADENGELSPSDSYTFIGSPSVSPGWKALDTQNIVLYRPNTPERNNLSRGVNKEFLSFADKLEDSESFERAQRIKRIVAMVAEEIYYSTMLVIPIGIYTNSGGLVQGALTLILRGLHDLSTDQRQLVLELGSLIADALEHLRMKDASVFEAGLVVRLENLRSDLSSAKTHDDVFGAFLHGIAKEPNVNSGLSFGSQNRWELSDHIIVWLLSSGYRELVARSARGRGLEILDNLKVIEPNNHPLLANEINPNFVPRKRRPHINNFQVWTFSLLKGNDNLLLSQYAALQGCKWVVSFPLMHSDHRVVGVIDCLREVPLGPEENAVLPLMLRRLSLQVCTALDRCRFECAINVARELTEEASAELEEFHAPDAYQIIVKKIISELGAEHADLFLDTDGSMILHASTRLKEPIGETMRYSYRIHPSRSGDIMGEVLATNSPRLSHATKTNLNLDHLSPSLRDLFANDYHYERLAIPLGKKKEHFGLPPGILYIRGQFSKINQGRTTKLVKKSGLITHEHLRRAQDLSVVAYRNAMMARLVERKGWLIDELQHALGQPLQYLRGLCDDLLINLSDFGIPDNKLYSLSVSLDRSFNLVHEARNHLAIYAKMCQTLDASDLCEFSISRLVRECCQFMKPEADRKKCRIIYNIQEDKFIRGFKDLFHSAVINLIDNAIKYSYEYRDIEVKLFEKPEQIISLVVENYGVGIPQPDLSRVFEPYFRSKVPDEKGARRGSGIGLAIVKHSIAVAHGGNVEVTSDPPRQIAPRITADETAMYPHKTTFTVNINRIELQKKWQESLLE